MTIFIGSRYENETITEYPKDGVRETILSTRRPASPSTFRYYLWDETDRIDRVTREVILDSSRWWEVMDANPDVLNPLDLSPGSVIKVPRG